MIRAIAKIVDLLPGLADPKGTADIGKKSPAACPPTATLTTSAAADAAIDPAGHLIERAG
ncbi:hypothetical protein INQ23_25565 [Escherichia coli]|nr:hypothetical protein [Escherichia coli]